MSHHKPLIVSGKLSFQGKKILLVSGDISYYVRIPRTQKDYVHGDRVRARITKRADGSQLAEVDVLSLEHRSEEVLLARIIAKNGKRYIWVLAELGFYETTIFTMPPHAREDDIYMVKFSREGKLNILNKFADSESFDMEERVLFFLSGTRMEFPRAAIVEAENIQQDKKSTINYALSKRRDFRGKMVFTIDGADAKDLDDAISIEEDENGNYILGVHIADVAEYVREHSQLDREALMRATSIYTPGKVIPMLPEVLSNDVCSLHPGEPKLVLSCLMTVDRQGIVKKTELVEGVIDSVHRGVYEEIQKSYEGEKGSRHPDDRKDPGIQEPGFSPTRGVLTIIPQNDQTQQTLSEAISLSYDLYEILKKRRQKEGKILFESVETIFGFPKEKTGIIVPESVRTRSRVAAHMLIEEFMVLANEEVAKWCDGHGLPFLSRVHGLPPYNSMEIIRQILSKGWGKSIGNQKKPQLRSEVAKQNQQRGIKESLEPGHIRAFLDTLPLEDVYKYSRLLLPKMAKATYTDTKHRHFGLALEYYAHFTSPIRRYPDLQVHRIIKEKLRGTLTPERIIHYKKILKKVARACSERERAAEDIERAFDSLYACRYMANHVGETYVGRVSGIAEFAYFVELDSGIEVTVYLPRYSRYIVDGVTGVLASVQGQRVAQIGEKIQITITGVIKDERRIVGEKV